MTDATRDLLAAAAAGDETAARSALEEGADIEAHGSGGMTPLVAATKGAAPFTGTRNSTAGA